MGDSFVGKNVLHVLFPAEGKTTTITTKQQKIHPMVTILIFSAGTEKYQQSLQRNIVCIIFCFPVGK